LSLKFERLHDKSKQILRTMEDLAEEGRHDKYQTNAAQEEVM
jgi:hypothetical protein